MTTEQIIWTVVIVVAALALLGFVVASMRKRSQQDNRVRAAEIREQADTRAAVIPDAQARAQEAEARAEQAKVRAEEAADRAQQARGEAAQVEALHEDQIRAADRLDPDVDHKADDYAPGTHAAERTETETADPHPSGASTGTHARDEHTPGGEPETIFDSSDPDTGSAVTSPDSRSIDLSSPPDGAASGTSSGAATATTSAAAATSAGDPADPASSTTSSAATSAAGLTGHTDTETSDTETSDTDTAGTDTAGTAGDTSRPAGRRIDPDAAPEPDWTDPDQRDGSGGGTGGSHRA